VSGGLFVPNKKYSTRGHAQAKITQIMRSRNRINRARNKAEESGEEFEIVENELIEIMAFPYESLKRGKK